MSFLAQRVHVSEILRHFSHIYPYHLRSVYDQTKMILAIFYRVVPHMLHAKYQPNWPSGSGEELVWFGCFGLNRPLRQYFNQFRDISQREGERREK